MTPARAEAALSIKNAVVNKAVFIPKDGLRVTACFTLPDGSRGAFVIQ